MKKLKPVVLVILDGWGESQQTKGNPFTKAKLPTTEKLSQYYPKVSLQASGLSVGLPWGEVGNSEVGHQALGGGCIIYQSLPKIDSSIENGAFFKNESLSKAMEKAKAKKKKFHIMGLLSDGAVHAHINHIFATLEMAKEKKLKDVYVHVFTDGRDTSPQSVAKYIEMLQKKMKKLRRGEIASISGRYYAMDRNENWDRTERAFLAMTQGGPTFEKDPIEAIEKQYKNKVFDEYIEPVTMVDKKENPIGLIENGDCLFFANFRDDRARQITRAFVSPKFNEFSKETKRPKLGSFVSMTEYEEGLPVSGVVFPSEEIDNPLGKILSQHKKKQYRIAETEKYAHVTYFFNCGKEDPYPGEDRQLVPSKNAPSYAKIPKMSADEVTKKLTGEIEKEKYDFLLVNYANPDMVGHTGDFNATVKAIEATDAYLNQIISATLGKGGCLLITADHGNAEELLNIKTGEMDTEHSSNPVPLWFVTPENHSEKPKEKEAQGASNGILGDIAPTVLELMGIEKPKSMTCTSLLSLLK